MDEDSPRSTIWRVLLAALMVIVLFGLLVAVGAAQDPSRLDRKVAVMERVIDEVLVQSPNVVVDSRQVTRGLVLEGYGVVFILDAGLHGRLPWVGRVVGSEDHVLPLLGRRPVPDADGGRELEESEVLSLEQWEAQSAEERAKRLDGLKNELVDALLDYGPTLTELRDEAWVTVVAFLGERGPFTREGPTRVSVKARMRDLRRHASGGISRQEARAAVVVEPR